MIQVAVREALVNTRLWLAAGPLLALSTALMVIIFSVEVPEANTTELPHTPSIDPTEATMLALTMLATMATLAVTVDRAVAHTRPRFAKYELAGMTPSGARTLLQQQVTVMTGVSVLAGLIMSVFLDKPMYELMSKVGAVHRPVEGAIHAYSLVGAAIVGTGLALIASAPAAKLAQSIYPVEAIKVRPPTQSSQSRGLRVAAVVTWALALVACLLTVLAPRFGATTHPVESANEVATFGGLHTLALAGALALTARSYCPKLIRLWTAVVPERYLPTAFLGRRGAAYQAGRSLEAFNMVLVGALLAGAASSIYYARSDLDPAGHGWVAARDMTAAFLTGVPLALVLVGAVVTTVVTTRSRFREVQTLRLAGATAWQVMVAGFFEAAILAVTALAVAAAGVAWVAVSVGVGMSGIPGSQGWPGSIGWGIPVWGIPLAVAAFGALLFAACALPSVFRGLRRPIIS